MSLTQPRAGEQSSFAAVKQQHQKVLILSRAAAWMPQQLLVFAICDAMVTALLPVVICS